VLRALLPAPAGAHGARRGAGSLRLSLLLLPVFVLLALFSFALAGGFIWLWARNGLSEDTRAPR